MKFKVKLKAFFDYEVEVETAKVSAAQDAASEALADYLENTLRNKREFDHFHEYLLKTELMEIKEVQPDSSDSENLAQDPNASARDTEWVLYLVIAVAIVLALVGAWTVLSYTWRVLDYLFF